MISEAGSPRDHGQRPRPKIELPEFPSICSQDTRNPPALSRLRSATPSPPRRPSLVAEFTPEFGKPSSSVRNEQLMSDVSASLSPRVYAQQCDAARGRQWADVSPTSGVWTPRCSSSASPSMPDDFAAIRCELQQLSSELQEVKRDRQADRETIAALSSELARCQQEIVNLKSSHEVYEDRVDGLARSDKQVKSRAPGLCGLDVAFKKADEQVKSLAPELSVLDSASVNAESSASGLDGLSEEATQLDDKFESMQTELDVISDHNTELNSKVAQLQFQVVQSVTESQQDRQILLGFMTRTNDERDGIVARVDTLASGLSDLDAKVAESATTHAHVAGCGQPCDSRMSSVEDAVRSLHHQFDKHIRTVQSWMQPGVDRLQVAPTINPIEQCRCRRQCQQPYADIHQTEGVSPWQPQDDVTRIQQQKTMCSGSGESVSDGSSPSSSQNYECDQRGMVLPQPVGHIAVPQSSACSTSSDETTGVSHSRDAPQPA